MANPLDALMAAGVRPVASHTPALQSPNAPDPAELLRRKQQIIQQEQAKTPIQMLMSLVLGH